MKINWKIRFKNKLWLSTFFGAIIVFAYTMCRLFDIELPIQEYELSKLIESLLTGLMLIGILQDPTTPGFQDSELALTYGTEEEPNEL